MICPGCSREVGTQYNYLSENGEEIRCYGCTIAYFLPDQPTLTFSVQNINLLKMENYTLTQCPDSYPALNAVIGVLEHALKNLKSKAALTAAKAYPHLVARDVHHIFHATGDDKDV